MGVADSSSKKLLCNCVVLGGGGGGGVVSWLLTSGKAGLSTDLKSAGGSDQDLTLLGLLQTVCQVGGRPGAAAIRQLGPAHHQGQQDRTGDQVVSHSATLPAAPHRSHPSDTSLPASQTGLQGKSSPMEGLGHLEHFLGIL